MENKYNGDGPYLGHVNAKEVMQEIERNSLTSFPLNEQEFC